jgi:hypothetical protein
MGERGGNIESGRENCGVTTSSSSGSAGQSSELPREIGGFCERNALISGTIYIENYAGSFTRSVANEHSPRE